MSRIKLPPTAERVPLNTAPEINARIRRTMERNLERVRAQGPQAVQRRLAELDRIRKALEALIAVCPGRGALANCTILDALDSADIDVPEIRPPARRRRGRSASFAAAYSNR